ncbi:MAG: long-chain fatty acid--CoA ligase [Actinomycetia bacterium]|nr:long-chain fatty acid--CoA ligase [Actinomycetes bacterium]
MNIVTLLEMAAAGTPDRIAIGSRRSGCQLTYARLIDRARAGAAALREMGVPEVVCLGMNGDAFAVALFACAWAGVPLVPLNYRLGAEQLADLLSRHRDALVISDRTPPTTARGIATEEWRAAFSATRADVARWEDDPDAVAILLYTSGTTSAPKAAVLRHRHVVSYLLGSVDFGAAGEDDAMLVSVPPYHIAGVSNLLSNVYAGRRIVYLESFSPQSWIESVRLEGITHALLVPTMLAAITEHLAESSDAEVPSLRSLAYGGAKMPMPVLERAIRLFPGVGFVNAYGLTETSSTIAVLGPDEHRRAFTGDPTAKARLSSAGRLLPGIEVQVRGPDGPLPAGAAGDLYVRGEQVSGEYREQGKRLDPEGWFATRDRGWVDGDGYLYVEGRSDDTIIRGGENIAPAEIEDVLLQHEAIAEAAVVGIPDERWGQAIAAAVVLRPGRSVETDEVREWVRSRLRTSKTPALIVVRDALPQTPTGKILRREVLSDLVRPTSANRLTPPPA